MLDPEAIDQQQQLLAAHRATLAHYLIQRAQLGSGYAPPGVTNGITEARAEIRRIKEVLRGWGATVEDLPDDEERPAAQSSDLAPTPNTQAHSMGWIVAAVLLAIIVFGLTLNTTLRFLRIGTAALGSLNFMLRIVLLLFTVGLFAPAVRTWLDQALVRLRMPRAFGPARVVLILTILLMLLGADQALHALAQVYNDRGVQLEQGGQLTTAIGEYQFAISLAPIYAQAHYNLAVAYERAVQYDLALSSYQNALLADPEMYLAYNNLARLYIARRGEYGEALEMLNRAQQRNPSDPLVRYTLLKNHGWALIGLRLYGQAETELRQALSLNIQGAAAYCLLAQVLEERPQPDVVAANTAWENCLRYENSGDEIEGALLDRARERLQH
jgi:Tfp pilus assembly protein PilF